MGISVMDGRTPARIGIPFDDFTRQMIVCEADAFEIVANRIGATPEGLGEDEMSAVCARLSQIQKDGTDRYISVMRGDIPDDREGEDPVMDGYLASRHNAWRRMPKDAAESKIRVIKEQWPNLASSFWRARRIFLMIESVLRRKHKSASSLAVALMDVEAQALKEFRAKRASWTANLVNGISAKFAPPRHVAEPVAARIVAIDESVKGELGEAVAKAVKNKGGRPRKKDRDADAMTQNEVAIMFNAACGAEVCNESMVSNWESFTRTEGRRGSRPPEGRMAAGRSSTPPICASIRRRKTRRSSPR